MTLSEVVHHIIWLKNALIELEQSYNPIFHADSNGAIELSKNLIISQRSKHIDKRYHFFREHLNNIFKLEYISSENNLADILTK